MEEDFIYLPTSTTKTTFTIYGCGKFREEKRVLNRAEAALLYVELHKWLFQEQVDETIETN